MATHVTHNDRTSTWMVDSANDTWIVAEDATFTVENEYGIADAYYGGTTIKVEGRINVTGGGYSAVLLESDESKVVFGNGSFIDARNANSAVQGNGDNLDIVNNGVIKAGSFAIVANNGGSIVNNGKLLGGHGIVSHVMAGDETVIENRGVIDVSGFGVNANGSAGEHSDLFNARDAIIRADNTAVNFGGTGEARLVNKGGIEGITAVKNGDGEVTLVNRGEMSGDIDLGGGADIVDLRGGTVNGMVTGGDGSDVYKVSNRQADLVETVLGGNDTVLSSAKFTLGDNFEILQLTGRKDVGGRGNELSNIVTGNKGDNGLFGLGGMDTLSGGEGDDVLQGGAAADIFVFATGAGHDVVADFENGSDKVDLSDWAAIANYADLILGHMTIEGDDIVFASGGDSLRFKNVEVSELDSGDFVFV